MEGVIIATFIGIGILATFAASVFLIFFNIDNFFLRCNLITRFSKNKKALLKTLTLQEKLAAQSPTLSQNTITEEINLPLQLLTLGNKKSRRTKGFYRELLLILRPQLKQYSQRLEMLLDNIFKDSSKWDANIFREHRRSQYLVYFLQEFRNSNIATTLSSFYPALTEEEKIQFERKLKEEVPNPLIYEFLFRVGIQPLVFAPWQVPDNVVEITEFYWKTEPKKIYQVTNPYGKLLFQGIYISSLGEEEKTPAGFQTSIAYIYEPENQNLLFTITYHYKTKPNFLLFTAEARKKILDWPKVYLNLPGTKDLFLWYTKNLNYSSRQLHHFEQSKFLHDTFLPNI